MKREKILAPAHNVIISTAYRIAEMDPVLRPFEIDAAAKKMRVRPSVLAKSVREAERNPRTSPPQLCTQPSPVAPSLCVSAANEEAKERVPPADVRAFFHAFLSDDKGGDR